MAAANAPFAGVQLAEFYWRTHLLSRVFASLALAWLIAAAWSRARATVARGLVAAAVAAWLAPRRRRAPSSGRTTSSAYTRAHRQELSSILAAAPALAPDAVIVLRVPAHPHLLATEAGYLARAWASLLYEDSKRGVPHGALVGDARHVVRPGADGFECRGERSPDCPRPDGQQTQLVPYERLVVLDYRPRGEPVRARGDAAPGWPADGASTGRMSGSVPRRAPAWLRPARQPPRPRGLAVAVRALGTALSLTVFALIGAASGIRGPPARGHERARPGRAGRGLRRRLGDRPARRAARATGRTSPSSRWRLPWDRSPGCGPVSRRCARRAPWDPTSRSPWRWARSSMR